MKLTATDRSALIRLASSLPSGSEEKKAILGTLAPLRDDGFKVHQRQYVIGAVAPATNVDFPMGTVLTSLRSGKPKSLRSGLPMFKVDSHSDDGTTIVYQYTVELGKIRRGEKFSVPSTQKCYA